MTAQVIEAPAGLEWLRGTLEEHRKSIVGLRMKVAALEADIEIRDKREAELRAALAESESQLDSSSADMRAAVKDDVLSDIDELGRRDKAMATVIVLLTAKVMASGAESLARLGIPPEVISTVRGMVYGGAAASVPAVPFSDGGNGLRYTPPPATAETPLDFACQAAAGSFARCDQAVASS